MDSSSGMRIYRMRTALARRDNFAAFIPVSACPCRPPFEVISVPLQVNGDPLGPFSWRSIHHKGTNSESTECAQIHLAPSICLRLACGIYSFYRLDIEH